MNDETENPERKKQGAIELANAYRDMMTTFGWRHFNNVILGRIRQESITDMDSVAPSELTVAHVAVSRGVRKCLDQIASELNWILNSQEKKS